MKKYLYDYIKEIDELLNNNKKIKDDIINNHLIKINFFQHERLIHLIVTLFYAIMFVLFGSLGVISFIFLIIAFILLLFLICYIIQYLYKQYDKMLSIK